jgi:hypothetical protein
MEIMSVELSTKKKIRGFIPQANYTDRLSDCRLSAKLVIQCYAAAR